MAVAPALAPLLKRVEAEIARQRRFEDLLAHDIRTDFGAAT